MPEEEKKLEGVKVLLGVSGGVAAYKAVDLACRLRRLGAELQTVMTENACRLVGPKSFEAVSGRKVYTSLWSGCEEFRIGHVDLASWADIVVLAPATANIIGKIANGICDEVLSTTVCVCACKPVVVAAAMNCNMWANAAVQRNVAMVREMGFELVGPVEGRLACGDDAIGRMAEPADIIEVVCRITSGINHS